MIAIEYVHKSQLATLKRCSKQLEYKDIMKLKPDFVNESALAGSSWHKFAEEIYRSTKPDKWDDWKYWAEFWIKDFQERKNKTIADGIEINTVEDIKAEEFIEMICEFLKQDYNRYAEPILIETPFKFEIRRGRVKYKFEGTIDQLLRIQTKYLHQFKWFYDNELSKLDKPYIYLHRDVKTGTRKTMSDIGLTTDDNINVYAYALAFGDFKLDIDSFDHTTRVHVIPYAHALYYTRDHLKYKKNTGKDDLGNYIHKVGDYKGQGMYFVKKPLEDLKRMEPELINLHKRINSGIYTRDGAVSNLCDHYCGYKNVCLHDWNSNG